MLLGLSPSFSFAECDLVRERNRFMKEFRQAKFGWVALSVSVLEPVIVWGALGIIYAAGLWGHAPIWLEDVFALSYIAGLGALGLAVVGMIKDSRRAFAALALVLAIINLVLCGLPMVSR